MAEGLGGIFIDIFTRLNMSSVAKTLSQANAEFKRGGEEAARAFSEGGVSGLKIMQDEFRELSRASQVAYENMSRGLADLQIQEARINELRARNFKASTDQMIGAQRDFDAALANSMKLMETANARSAETRAAQIMPAPVPIGRGGRDEPEEEERGRGTRFAPVPRGGGSRFGNALGLGATVGTIIGGIDVAKQSAEMQDALNRLVTVTQEAPGNIKMIQDAIQRISVKTGYNPQELANVALQGEKRGYKGRDLASILDVTAQLSRQEKIPLDEALQGIAITAQNYGKRPDQLADVASQLNVAVGHSGTSMQGFVGALPNVEQRGAAAGFTQEQLWGVLAQATRSGLSPERAAMNEDNLIRSLAGLNGPARDMINTLFSQAGAKGDDGSPLTAASISNNLGKLGLPGAVNTIINKGVLPNLTPEQRVLLPAVFKNDQAKENIEEMMSTFTDPKTLAFANSPAIQGGAMSPMQVSKAAQKAGVNPEDISRLRDLAKAEQVQHGFGAQLKGRDSDQQSIAGVLRKAFGTSEAARIAMIIGYGDNRPEETQRQTGQLVSDIGGAKADDQGNVEGFAKAMDTTVAQTDRAKAAWHNVAITLGDEFGPAVKTAMSGLADFGNWLSQHQGALDTFAATMGGIAAIWAGDKIAKGIKSFVEPTANLLKLGAGKLSGVMPNTNVLTNPYSAEAAAGTSAAGAGLDGAAGSLSTAAGALQSAAASLSGAAGAESGAATALDGAATAESTAATALDGSATALDGSASAMDGAAARVTAGASVPSVLPTAPGVKPGTGGFWSKFGRVLPGIGTALVMGDGQEDANRQRHPEQYQPDGTPKSPQQLIDMLPKNGWARGGIVGYEGGTDKVADPYGQPLLGQPDMLRDSLLGMLPGGKAVGLRGGEGILTPGAVQRLGGKNALDSLNAGEDPWSNPVKVGTTFFGSFAKGVAKYSKWGKYLTAASQSIDSLTGASEDAEGEGHRGPTRTTLEEMLMGGMSPEQMESMGIHRGKRGGLMAADGSYLPHPGGEGIGKGSTIQSWLGSQLLKAGLSPDEARGILAMNQVEGGASNAQSLLGFTEGQASGPQGHLQAFLNQWNDPSRRVDGQVPGVGPGGRVTDPNAYMTWIRQRIVGQNGAASDWQGNRQPNPQDYQNGLMNAWGQNNGGWAGYSGGGIVGFEGGGIPLTPPTPNPPPPAPPVPPVRPPQQGPKAAVDQSKLPFIPGVTGGKPLTGPTTPPQGLAGTPPPPPKTGMGALQQQELHLGAPGTEPGTYPKTVGDRGINENTSRQGGMGNSSKGFGVSGGAIGMAEGAASMAAGAFGGGGASQAAFQLINRAIGYGGQLVGIGLSGLMETFLPNNSPLADPTNNLLGKAALGIAGAHKSPQNSAGNSAMQLQPKDGLDAGAQPGGAKQVLPMVHMDHPTINNHGDQDWGGMHSAINQALFGAVDVGHA